MIYSSSFTTTIIFIIVNTGAMVAGVGGAAFSPPEGIQMETRQPVPVLLEVGPHG